MKRLSYLVIFMLALLLVEDVSAQGIVVYKKDGLMPHYSYTEVDSVVTAEEFIIYKNNGDVINYSFTEVDSLVAYPLYPPLADVLAVDLGLGNGTFWASHNVGATNPEDEGDYFAWGETSARTNFTIENYYYYNSVTNGFFDIGTDITSTTFDVAYMKWGSSWHIPTYMQIEELVQRCTWTETTYNNVSGYMVTGPNGNSIFLPSSVWSSTRDAGGDGAYYLNWNGSYDVKGRCYGLNVRPVWN